MEELNLKVGVETTSQDGTGNLGIMLFYGEGELYIYIGLFKWSVKIGKQWML